MAEWTIPICIPDEGKLRGRVIGGQRAGPAGDMMN